MKTAAIGILALVPMITGPVPEAERSLVAAMCNGSKIEIPLGNREQEDDGNCHFKGCHAGTCREKSKRGKLI